MGKAMAIIIVGTCLLGVLPIFYIKYYGTEMQQGILWVESVILMFVWFVLIWAILIFSIYFCTESSIYEAMYIFALSYGVEHIFYCIRVLVEHFTGGIIGNKHPLVYIPCLAGCFPEIVLGDADEDIKQELLKSYFESIVQKDCIVYSGIRDTHLFFRLVSYLMQNMGSRFSIPAVGKALKSNENTVASYLNFLCDSYICVDVRNFSYSLKETSRSQHKCYFIDNGLVSANVFRYSPQSGSALENLVYNELRNKGYMNISFDNSKTECDFLAYKNGKAYGFQVCYELNDMNLKRELYGFELENVMLEKKTLLTYNQKETYGDIEVVPFWEWVMSPPFT